MYQRGHLSCFLYRFILFRVGMGSWNLSEKIKLFPSFPLRGVTPGFS